MPDAVFENLERRGLIKGDLKAGVEVTSLGRTFVRRVLADGDGFLEQHQQREPAMVPDAGRGALTNHCESPLAWLHRRRGKSGESFICDAAFAAGERYRRDFTFAGIEQRTTTTWSASGATKKTGFCPGQLSDAAIDARARLGAADKALGPDLAPLARAVCGELIGVEEMEKRAGLPKRSGKVVLRIALNALARHYGYLSGGRQGGLHNCT